MKIKEILSPDCTLCGVKATSKKVVIEKLSRLMAEKEVSLTCPEIFDSLINRERLGSTGLGHGVAIPHSKLPNAHKAIAAFIQLEAGVEFDAADDKKVDLLFALLLPEDSDDEHVQILAILAEMFSNDEFLSKLRAATMPEELYELITS